MGQSITPRIRHTATFLRSRGIRATCVEFTFFEDEEGEALLSQEIVVGRESVRPTRVASGSRSRIGWEEFAEKLDDVGHRIFSRIFELAEQRSLLVRWGVAGFSLSVPVDDDHVTILFGYPAHASHGQCLVTTFRRSWGMGQKIEASEQLIGDLMLRARAVGPFRPMPTGQDLVWQISEDVGEDEVKGFETWLDAVLEGVAECHLVQ